MNTSPEEKLKIVEQLKAMAENANIRAETEFLRIIASSILKSSPIIDKYSTWLLAGCGAIASIMIANVNAVIPFLGTVEFKMSIYLLTVSAVIGLLQKSRAMKVQGFSEIAERLFIGAEPLQTKHQQAFEELWKMAAEQGVDFRIGPELNIERIRSEMAALTPFFFKTKLLKHFDKGAQNELHGWRQAVVGLRWQMYFFAFQFLLFVTFLLFAGFSINAV